MPFFIIVLCVMPDDFTPQRESADAQWVRGTRMTVASVSFFRVSTGLENPGKSLNWKKIPGLETP